MCVPPTGCGRLRIPTAGGALVLLDVGVDGYHRGLVNAAAAVGGGLASRFPAAARAVADVVFFTMGSNLSGLLRKSWATFVSFPSSLRFPPYHTTPLACFFCWCGLPVSLPPSTPFSPLDFRILFYRTTIQRFVLRGFYPPRSLACCVSIDAKLYRCSLAVSALPTHPLIPLDIDL